MCCRGCSDQCALMHNEMASCRKVICSCKRMFATIHLRDHAWTSCKDHAPNVFDRFPTCQCCSVRQSNYDLYVRQGEWRDSVVLPAGADHRQRRSKTGTLSCQCNQCNFDRTSYLHWEKIVSSRPKPHDFCMHDTTSHWIVCHVILHVRILDLGRD